MMVNASPPFVLVFTFHTPPHPSRRAAAEAREQAAIAAEQRQRLFEQSAHGKAAHKSQVNLRKQTALEDRMAEQRVQDWNS